MNANLSSANHNDLRGTAIAVSRAAVVPDDFRLARYSRAPELGPRLLFFSGGSALKETSKALIHYTQNSIHLITPFDSGGSSAKLRRSFPMISVGDLRSRLMALSDTRFHGHPEIYRLFSHRLEEDAVAQVLLTEIRAMAEATHPMMLQVPAPLRDIVRSHLEFFLDHMPEDFDLRGASIGNLILAGGYLAYKADIDAVLFLFSKLVEVKGIVRPVVNANLHLAAELVDGTTLTGQHRITAQVPTQRPPIRELRLVRDASPQRADQGAAETFIDARTRQLIDQADLICFPIGSFYTSVLACLLPGGVGQAICRRGCPKVYVPNCGTDHEARDLSPSQAVAVLLETLRRDCGDDVPSSALLNFVLVDTELARYAGGLSPQDINYGAIEALGVQVIATPLVTRESAPFLDPDLLARALLSLA
jgi:CofD-related protein of GAK system